MRVCDALTTISCDICLYVELVFIVFTAVQDIVQDEDRHTTHVFLLKWLLCSNCLRPFPAVSPIFVISHPSPLCLSPSQTWPITWQWTTSSSRSSCWLLAWLQPGSEVSSHQLLLCGGATWSRHSQWCSLCSCFVVTDQWISHTHLTFSPFNRNWGMGETFFKLLVPM